MGVHTQGHEGAMGGGVYGIHGGGHSTTMCLQVWKVWLMHTHIACTSLARGRTKQLSLIAVAH